MAMVKQTRQEYYDWCAANKQPLPEVISEMTVVGTDPNGNRMLARPGDINDKDVREFDPETGECTPWRKE